MYGPEGNQPLGANHEAPPPLRPSAPPLRSAAIALVAMVGASSASEPDTGTSGVARDTSAPPTWNHPALSPDAVVLRAEWCVGDDVRCAELVEAVQVTHLRGHDGVAPFGGDVRVVFPERFAIDPPPEALAEYGESPSLPAVGEELQGYSGPWPAHVELTPAPDLGPPRTSAVAAADFEVWAGRVTDEAGWRDALRQARRARFEAGLVSAQRVAAAALTAGATDIAPRATTGGVRATVDADTLNRLRADPTFGRIDLDLPPTDDCGLDSTEDYAVTINGQELAEILQTQQFYDQDDGGCCAAIAVFSQNPVWNGHPGFKNATTGQSRVLGCESPSCTDSYTPSLTGTIAHPTATAAMALADLTLGQDSAITGTLDRARRSGVARYATGYTFPDGDEAFLLDRLDDPGTENIAIVAQSNSFSQACTGQTAKDQSFNALFEAGMAVFNSTGNQGSSSTCNVQAPAPALGVFAVNQYKFLPTGEPALDTGASIGSVDWSIIDLVAPTPIRYGLSHYDGPTFGNGGTTRYGADWSRDGNVGVDDDSDGTITSLENGGFNGSSAATPTVAGAAAVLRRWFIEDVSTAIEDPGLLYALMLSMGDGFNGTTFLHSGYHRRMGAGQTKLRRFDNDHMDARWVWDASSVCVPHGQVVLLYQGVVAAGADTFEATTFRYDPDHDTTGNLDDVNLYLQRQLADGTWSTILQDTAFGEKQRIFSDGFSGIIGASIRLLASGQSVATDGWAGCGNNQIRVYYSLYLEDNDGSLPTCVEHN
jgi:hypothetical protein